MIYHAYTPSWTLQSVAANQGDSATLTKGRLMPATNDPARNVEGEQGMGDSRFGHTELKDQFGGRVGL
ncbi:hypothetical protein WJX79_006218 [Trebouxia sp. C0005]